MFYGLHEWTAARTGGLVDARVIMLFNTALESPLGQIAMIPMLAWIANSAPAHLKATYFAVMASFSNLALAASQLGTVYLNRVFEVKRGDYGELGRPDDRRRGADPAPAAGGGGRRAAVRAANRLRGPQLDQSPINGRRVPPHDRCVGDSPFTHPKARCGYPPPCNPAGGPLFPLPVSRSRRRCNPSRACIGRHGARRAGSGRLRGRTWC